CYWLLFVEYYYLRPMLSARNIYKSYGSLPILKGVDLDVKRGEIEVLWVLQGQEKVHCSISLVLLPYPIREPSFLTVQKSIAYRQRSFPNFAIKISVSSSSFTICCPNLTRWRTFACRPLSPDWAKRK